MSKVTFTIDGREVSAEDNETLLDVARNMGIEIPTLCHSPMVSTFGSCRLCSVKITTKWGRERIVTSCNYTAEDGLVVETNSPPVREIRKTLLELLLARCPNVDLLKEMGREYGIEKTRFEEGDPNERCILCGLCTRICEERVGVSAINFANRGTNRAIEGPVGKSMGANLSDACVGCGACAFICPTGAIGYKGVYTKIRSSFPMAEVEENTFGRVRKDDEVLGIYEKCYGVRSTKEKILERSQDGGAVTTLLAYALNEGIIDAAVITVAGDDWVPSTIVATTYDELKKGAGTKYTYYPSGIGISEAIEMGYEKIAFVGLPCQIGGLRKVLTSDQPYAFDKKKVKLLVGLFCMNVFHQGLMDYIRDNMMPLKEVKKLDIKGGKLKVFDQGNELHTTPLKEISGYVNKGCHACRDYTAELADVAIGSVGSEPGCATVIARTDIGREVIDGLFEKECTVKREITDLSELIRLTEIKRKRAEKEGY
ncbi:MAG: Coenzyme F420 hydrogenase/dehydrogenase, beta subunit C-terminal domain [Halobacteriota archaeon]|nr:Coenzyme F420 hydrogenase/dehydrogenase, beta subunit C-terminal domain [Halobacteriota archaeon]